MLPNLADLLNTAADQIGRELKSAQRSRVAPDFSPDNFQRRVVDSSARLLRVLAPAGSGKTATLVEKALRIVEQDRRASVLMLTFTNAGVNAFNEAVRTRAPALQARCRATTLNKFGLHALKSVNPTIKSFPNNKPFIAHKQVKAASDGPSGLQLAEGGHFPFLHIWDAVEVTKQLGLSPIKRDSKDDLATLKFLDQLGTLNVLGAHLERAEVPIACDPEAIAEDWLPFWREVLQSVRHLGLTLEDQKFRGYWDQLDNSSLAKHIGSKGITHLLVDEFQDTNLLELYLVCSIARANNSALYIVGDDDQCIYEWKGCTPHFITSPDALIPGLLQTTDSFDTVILERNYRCPRNIVQVSRRLIEYNVNRVAKNIVAHQDDDAHIRHVRMPTSAVSMLTLVRLIAAVGMSDREHRFALLARKKAQLVPLQVLLTKHEIDFYIPPDCNIFVQDTFKALLDAYSARMVVRGVRPSPGTQRSRDLLRGLANRVWKKELFGDDKDVVDEALRGVTSIQQGIDAIDGAGWLPGKRNESSTIATAIREFMEADTCAEALQALFGCFAGFQQDYGRSKDDIFLRDPPLGLLIDLATSYEDEDEFLRDLERTRIRAEAMDGADGREDARVVLLTAYRAKGLQFDTVVVLDANDGFWPASQAVAAGRMEEERRLFYVAVTRAKSNLLLFNSDFVQGVPRAISPFVTELGLDDAARLAPSMPDDVVTALLSLYPAQKR